MNNICIETVPMKVYRVDWDMGFGAVVPSMCLGRLGLNQTHFRIELNSFYSKFSF